MNKNVLNHIVRLKNKARSIVEEMPGLPVFLRAHNMWRHRKLITPTEHDQVLIQIIDDGRLTSRYSFMVTMSCGIAILGLLLSSPAVIIGAMLISPLMGPIMSLGFSLCILDLKQLKKALEGIVVGLVLSVFFSFCIVSISPITDPTPEILARTQPNLFDLLVAVFSGLAGGYATIKQKGAAIVGVAIATALMPPLTVVGFGLATGNAQITSGAFFLFMTNLLAISLSVTALAKWYGFGKHNSPHHTLWQTGLIFGAFVILSIPLGLSLMDIAYQSYVTKTTKAEIKKHFEGTNSRISNYTINFTKSGDVALDCLMITDAYLPGAEPDLQEKLTDSVGKSVKLSLDQIVVAKEQQNKPKEISSEIVNSALTNPMQSKINLMTAQEEMAKAIHNAVFFPLNFVRVDAATDSVIIQPKLAKGTTFAVLRSVEEKLSKRFPDWYVAIMPPVQALPFIYYEIGKTQPTATESDKLEDIIWALNRWDVQEVVVVGFASTTGEFQRFDNTSLAYHRAKDIVDKLEAAGIKATPRAEYRSFDQNRDERNYGINSFHRVEIRLSRPLDLPEPVIEAEALDKATKIFGPFLPN